MTTLQEEVKVTTHAPHAPEFKPLSTDFKYEFARAINLAWFKLFHGIRYRAKGNIPTVGPVIVTPNHVSFYDPTGVAAGIPYRVRFMAWDALFRVPVLKQILYGWGAYPVKLKSADKGAIVETLRILRHGEAVIIFPEGIRHDSPHLSPFEQGPARLAIQTGALLMPVTVLGAYESWPCTRALPRLFKPLNIKYHKPVSPQDLPANMDMKEKVAELNRRVAVQIDRRLRAWKRFHEKR